MADDNDTPQLCFITGASSGFGRALTEAALAKGDRVVGAARRTEALAGLAASHPDRLETLRLDVTDAGAVDHAVSRVLDRYGQIDVLVNNAGKTHVGAAEETEEPELRSLFELHFFAPVALGTRRPAVHAGSAQACHRTDEQYGRADVFRRVFGLQRHQICAGRLLRGRRRRSGPIPHQGPHCRARRLSDRAVRRLRRQRRNGDLRRHGGDDPGHDPLERR